LTEELGDIEYRRLAQALERRLRLVVAGHGGVVQPGINLGDGVVATFATADEAVRAGIDAIDSGRDSPLRLHVGVHQGMVLREHGRVYGKAVNLASRISERSAPDEVLVSESIRNSLGANDDSGIAFVDRGRQRLKGVTTPQRLFAALPAT
jgi:adenylate cyclase